MNIYIAADHGGIRLKNKILQHLRDKRYDVVDMGAYEYELEDDYPDYVAPAMEKLSEDPESVAILSCRNGVGVCMHANKFRGIRCGLCFNKDHTESAKKDDNINVLALPADYLSTIEAFQVVDTFIETPFSNEERHIRRLEKVAQTLKSFVTEKKKPPEELTEEQKKSFEF